MVHILIVEDEPTLCEAYVLILKKLHKKGQISEFVTWVCHTAKSTKKTLDILQESKTALDLCIADIRLNPKTSTEGFEGGLEIGSRLRLDHPECRIMVVSALMDAYLFYAIIKDVRPSGFLIKSETNFDSLSKDIVAVLEGKTVYSKSVSAFVNNDILANNDFDRVDLKILYLLSKGNTLSQVAKKISLSLSGVEYRKRKIARKLGATSSNINELLESVRKHWDFA